MFECMYVSAVQLPIRHMKGSPVNKKLELYTIGNGPLSRKILRELASGLEDPL